MALCDSWTLFHFIHCITFISAWKLSSALCSTIEKLSVNRKTTQKQTQQIQLTKIDIEIGTYYKR